MAKKKPSIAGKIDEIFKEKEEELSDDLFDVNTAKGMVNISLSRLIPNPNQPRKTFFNQTIKELAESIKEQGVLSPIIVRPLGKKYEIIAGERRYKAAEKAGLKELPALIRKVSNGEARIISLIENIQREDLNDIDRASALKELKNSLNLSWIEVGERLGLSRNRVLELVSLLDLPEEVKEDIRQKKLTAKHGRALRLLLKQPEVLYDSYNFIKAKNLASNESLELVKAIKSTPGRTLEEAYNQLKESKPKKQKVKKDPIETAISETEHLIKTLDKVLITELLQPERKILRGSLLDIQKKIRRLLNEIKN